MYCVALTVVSFAIPTSTSYPVELEDQIVRQRSAVSVSHHCAAACVLLSVFVFV